MMRLLWIPVLCACSAPPATAPVEPSAPTDPPAEAAPPSSLLEALIARAGDAPVMLVATATGVVARTEAAVLATVVEGEVEAAEYDPAAGLVWFRRGGSLWAVDLRAPAPAPVEIVARLPDVTVTVGGASSYGNPAGEPWHLALVWAAEPGLEVDVAIEDFVEEDQLAAARAAEIVGRAWLIAEHDRRRDAVPEARPAARMSAVPDCDDPEECGAAVEFGATGWRLFVARYDCGDYCHWGCLLVDPAGKVTRPELAGTPAWIDLADADEAGTCGAFRFDAAEARFAHGDQLCVPGHGCAAMGGPILGFLRPGPTLSLGY